MNILYISQMGPEKWAGPTYSIPRQIAAQSKYDNVFWYHMRNNINEDWNQHYPIHLIKEFPNCKINELPEPFNKPDLVIIEQFYGYATLPIRKEIMNGNIPYIIIPRGELTEKAQKRKRLKKQIANALIFNEFAKKALAIQYLTENERVDSGNKWNDKSIVIPNGINRKNEVKSIFNSDKIVCSYIGRIESYHKGFDLLIGACSEIKKKLESANCEIHIYGPDVENQRISLERQICDLELSSIIFFHDAVFGEEKETVLLKSDVFIMTSRFEGHPMALIEAMSYGIPCFATEGTNMSIEISETDSGWTASNDINSIKISLEKMLDERKELASKGKNALILSSNYNWNEISKKSHTIYEDLLS
ncbi:glycosyltransferase [Paraclostridium sordellii]|uniref:glycosyltransferase n=1 Tax=Paraclostridium sordellii TaxID=1505 RepID=UPI0005E343BC|nr:glycosyltransferase [Paeniclostridium sordellii]CEP49072.1 group 1 glycosyl transferase [[Clostridium] sordellii] [Paeniclostridium sordellii]